MKVLKLDETLAFFDKSNKKLTLAKTAYSMEDYSVTKRNEIGSYVDIWIDLESIIQSKVTQKEKNKYHVLMHICGIWKKWYR